MIIRHRQITKLDPSFVKKKLQGFFKEDCIDQDITTATMQNKKNIVTAQVIAKEELIFVGNEIINQGFSECRIIEMKDDGRKVKSGEGIATLKGRVDIILKKERVILNLLQRLSGIASTTHTLAEKLKEFNIQLLDTRKTTPGLREFEKFAVSIGGGINHRFSLKDAVMIKDNHLRGDPNLKQMAERAASQNPQTDIQIEIDTRDQLVEALNTKATSVLLDNFDPQTLEETINYIRAHKNGNETYIELSGGITKENIGDYCILGVDGISMGALTHDIKSKDISLNLK